MKQWQEDFLHTFLGVFSLLLIVSSMFSGFLTLAAGATAGLAAIIVLLPSITLVSLAVSLTAAVRVNT